jgi:hypothetical protein
MVVSAPATAGTVKVVNGVIVIAVSGLVLNSKNREAERHEGRSF